jgi:hypothetical protein
MTATVANAVETAVNSGIYQMTVDQAAATVALTDSENNPITTASVTGGADSAEKVSGTYTLKNDTVKNYTLKFTADGYEDVEVKINVVGAVTTNAKLTSDATGNNELIKKEDVYTVAVNGDAYVILGTEFTANTTTVVKVDGTKLDKTGNDYVINTSAAKANNGTYEVEISTTDGKVQTVKFDLEVTKLERTVTITATEKTTFVTLKLSSLKDLTKSQVENGYTVTVTSADKGSTFDPKTVKVAATLDTVTDNNDDTATIKFNLTYDEGGSGDYTLAAGDTVTITIIGDTANCTEKVANYDTDKTYLTVVAVP